MKNKDNQPGDAADLRRQAEEIARKKALQLPENLDTLSSEEQRQLLHELRVHQIELTMQNEALHQTQEELESSWVRYYNLYDLAPMGYLTLSENGLILEANLTASSLLGVARSALVKKSLASFIFREDQDIYYLHCQQLFKTGAPQVCELRLVKKDGSLCWARLESTMAQDSESGDVLYYTVISDITEREQVEEALHKALAQANEGKRILDALMEQVPEGITIADAPDVRIRMVSRYGRELTGKSKEILEGITVDKHTRQWDIYCADGVTPAKNEDLPLTRATQKGELVKDEEWVLGKQSGKRIPILCNAGPIRDDVGNIIGGVIAWRDITERKRAEEALRESQERFRTLYENSTVGLYRTTPDGRIHLANPALVRMLGYSSFDDLSTRNLEKNGFEPSYPRTQFVENIEKDGEVKGLESAWKRKDGTIIFVRESARAIRDSQAKTLYYDGTVEDITERKKTEEEIRKKNAELKAFVDMLSHDLKNPVVSIQGFCSLLMKNHIKDLNEKALFYIQRMQANASLMTNLLGDLVELSRIGRIEDKKTKISIQEVIKSVWAGASTSLATQNVEFVSPENLPQLFYSEKRLYQIFYNLLSNALKFRDEERKTKVEIGHQEDKDNYIFFVRDNGIGIEQKYHNKIFDSFSQLKETKSEGTGMGLAIVKKIVEANQGKVWVESRKGAGSTFYFTIPKNVKS